ncbi:MAG: signal peptidase I [Pseudomonadota bacterium]
MDMNIPLVLVALVFLTGGVVIFDKFFWSKQRARAVTHYEKNILENGIEPDGQLIEKMQKEPAWIEYPKAFFPVLLVVLCLRSFLVEPFTIPTGSMMPTLIAGDFVLVNKFTYGLRLPLGGIKILDVSDPQRGDVMVFKFPESPSTNFIKRVIGLPGDVIEYRDKQLIINGEIISRQLLAQIPEQNITEFLENLDGVEHKIWIEGRNQFLNQTTWRVPDNHYFVMGDNRDSSHDSRFWGFVPEHYIVGKAFAIWMHKLGWTLPSFARNGLIQ